LLPPLANYVSSGTQKWYTKPRGGGAISELTQEVPANQRLSRGVSEGTRTPDRLDHNQELYQLSYAHRDERQSSIAITPQFVERS
jgi:hypothetical protein